MSRAPKRVVPTLQLASLLVWTSLAAYPQAERLPQLQVRVAGTHLDWPPQERPVSLDVSGPGGLHASRLFAPGEALAFDLLELGSPKTLEDGVYRFELRVLGLTTESEAELAHLLPPASTGQIEAQSGAVRLQERRAPEPAPPSALGEAPAQADPKLFRVASEVVTDSGDAPAFQLNDTGTNEDEWFMTSDSVSDQDFGISWQRYNFTAFTYPLVIEDEINNYALFLESNGVNGRTDVGINTSTPAVTLHMRDAIPRIYLDDATQPGTWEVRGDSVQFSVRDALAPSTRFVIEPGVASNQLVLDSSGNVGIGTSNPQGQLHISGSSGGDVFSGMGPDLLAGPAFNFGYAGSSFGLGSGFFNARPAAGTVAPNPALYFMTNNIERMVVDNVGQIGVDLDTTPLDGFDPQHPIHAEQSGARLTAAGVWTNASSRALKAGIEPLTLAEASAALGALEPVKFHYRVEPTDSQVGFIAEDVPDLVATPDRTTLAPTDIVGVLTRVVQDQQRVLEELQPLVQNQQELLEELQALVQEQQSRLEAYGRRVAGDSLEHVAGR